MASTAELAPREDAFPDPSAQENGLREFGSGDPAPRNATSGAIGAREAGPGEMDSHAWIARQMAAEEIAPDAVTADEIRERAYDLWERHHRPEGFEIAFWIMAERELWAERRRRTPGGAAPDPRGRP